jgi:hypothetical protein
MRNHPNIDSLLKLVEDILQDLQTAKELLLEVRLVDGIEGKLPIELSRKLYDYFELNQDE